MNRSQFERDSNFSRIVFKIIFSVVVIFMVIYFVGLIFVGTSLYDSVQENDGNIGQTIGSFVKDIKRGMDDD